MGRKRRSRYSRGFSTGQKLILVGLMSVVLALVILVSCALFSTDKVKETDEITVGIDVAKYQGTIDWQQVALSGVDFAMLKASALYLSAYFIADSQLSITASRKWVRFAKSIS